MIMKRFIIGLAGCLLIILNLVGCGEEEAVPLTLGEWPADIKILGDKAYVVNTGDNNIQIIDISELGKAAYIVNGTARTITVFDMETSKIEKGLESNKEIGLIEIGDGTMPEKIGFVGNNKAYVSCNGTKSVKVVDIAARQVIRNIEVGVAPWGVAVVGKKVYVCNTYAVYDAAANATSYSKATVSVIDSSTDAIVKDINVETNPTEITVSGDKVIVQCTGNYADITGRLCVIDANSDAVVKTIDLNTTPSGIAVSPKGMVYVTSFGGLLRVDIDSGSVGAPLVEFGGGSGLVFDRAGNGYICVPDWQGGGNDKLLVMDTSEKLAGTYKVGGGASIIAIKE